MAAELSKTELGTLGETLASNWLVAQGWRQCDRQWHCRWGELDLVMAKGPADSQGQIAFVEVKTRSQGNWDAYGLMAITRTKQAKLWKAAQFYLMKQPQWAEAACRFDVALVACRRDRPPAANPAQRLSLEDGRYLVLQDYIEHAFDATRR